jgi:ethanolamine ammonia-lyase large subunit
LSIIIKVKMKKFFVLMMVACFIATLFTESALATTPTKKTVKTTATTTKAKATTTKAKTTAKAKTTTKSVAAAKETATVAVKDTVAVVKKEDSLVKTVYTALKDTVTKVAIDKLNKTSFGAKDSTVNKVKSTLGGIFGAK